MVLDEKSGSMKRSKFSEEHIVYAIWEAESGPQIGDLCRQLGGRRPPSTPGKISART